MNSEHYRKLLAGVDVWNEYCLRRRAIDKNWVADLSGADLSNADLSGADFIGADLRRADLREVFFRGANFADANFSGTNLWLAQFNDSDIKKIPNFKKITIGGYICYIQPDWLQIGCWCGTPDELRNATVTEAVKYSMHALSWLREHRETALQICEEMRK